MGKVWKLFSFMNLYWTILAYHSIPTTPLFSCENVLGSIHTFISNSKVAHGSLSKGSHGYMKVFLPLSKCFLGLLYSKLLCSPSPYMLWPYQYKLITHEKCPKTLGMNTNWVDFIWIIFICIYVFLNSSIRDKTVYDY